MRFATICLIATVLCTTVSTFAGDLSGETKASVKKAAVMVWLGAADGPGKTKWLGSGSGSFINATGLVVTNNHVVDPAHGLPLFEKFNARNQYNLPVYSVIVNSGTDDEETYKGMVKYQNESADLALVQVVDEDNKPLKTEHFLKTYPSEDVVVAGKLWCYGFPGGNSRATKNQNAKVNISNGNIRGIQRSPGGRINMIETDVKAAPGNSGGPLVNANGEMVGVLSQGGMSDKSGDGIAVRIIPADLVVDMVRVADGLGKVGEETDLGPFKNLARWKGNTAKNQSLASRLGIRDDQMVAVSNDIEAGDYDAAAKGLEPLLVRDKFRRFAKPMQFRIQALQGELLLRQGDYAGAKAMFKKVRRSDQPAVAWYGKARFEVLDDHADGQFNGKPISDLDNFNKLAAQRADTALVSARRTLDSYEDRQLNSFKDWKNLIKRLQKHEEELWMANSLMPGPAEIQAYRIWRFQELVHMEGFSILNDEREKLGDKIDTFNRNIAKKTRQDSRDINNKINRFAKNQDTIGDAFIELRQLMGSEGFRIDDPMAADILE